MFVVAAAKRLLYVHIFFNTISFRDNETKSERTKQQSIESRQWNYSSAYKFLLRPKHIITSSIRNQVIAGEHKYSNYVLSLNLMFFSIA